MKKEIIAFISFIKKITFWQWILLIAGGVLAFDIGWVIGFYSDSGL
jgi:hypothetical protein